MSSPISIDSAAAILAEIRRHKKIVSMEREKLEIDSLISEKDYLEKNIQRDTEYFTATFLEESQIKVQFQRGDFDQITLRTKLAILESRRGRLTLNNKTALEEIKLLSRRLEILYQKKEESEEWLNNLDLRVQMFSFVKLTIDERNLDYLIVPDRYKSLKDVVSINLLLISSHLASSLLGKEVGSFEYTAQNGKKSLCELEDIFLASEPQLEEFARIEYSLDNFSVNQVLFIDHKYDVHTPELLPEYRHGEQPPRQRKGG